MPRSPSRSPILSILKGLEEAEDDGGEIDPREGDGQDDDANNDVGGVAVRVDEDEDATREGHHHIQEGEEHPRQEEEAAFRPYSMYHNQRHNDINCGDQQQNRQEDVGSCIRVRVNDSKSDGIFKLNSLLRFLNVQETVDGHHELQDTDQQERKDSNG